MLGANAATWEHYRSSKFRARFASPALDRSSPGVAASTLGSTEQTGPPAYWAKCPWNDRNGKWNTSLRVLHLKEDAVDWNRVEGNWKQVKGKVKEQWGKLTDDDLDVIAGKQDQLQGKIQERYGYAKDRAQKEMDDWYTRQTW